MKFEYEDLEVLLKIQAIDLAVMKIKKQRAELPQRVKVQLLRKKRDEISAKLDQALEIEKKAKAEFTKVEDEDRQLSDKQKRAQELIDTSGTDYRKVESQSKEMAGIAKRRDTLAEQMLEMQVNLDKIESVRKAQNQTAQQANVQAVAQQQAPHAAPFPPQVDQYGNPVQPINPDDDGLPF